MRDKEVKLTLTIPSAMYERLQEIGQKAGYGNIDDFIQFILQELFPMEVEEMDRIEKAVIEQRLRDLGYM
jgi:Arc/MetJ-type ribon-helix-helix transcriptional regulator